MRPILLSACILVLFTAGCTTTYVKKDFSSDTSFFEKVNKISGSVDIIKMNDSLVAARNINISNGSLRWKISYYNYFERDSLITKNYILPLKDIKTVSTIDHGGMNILYGALAGMAAGGALGVLLPTRTSSNTGDHFDYMQSIVGISLLGILPGAIFGSIMGNEDLYVFDDSFDGNLKKYNPSHKFGLKIGRHSGLNYKEARRGNYELTIPAKITGYEIPGFMATLFYNQPFSRQLLISYELSFISEKTDAWYWVSIPEDINNMDSDFKTFSSRSAESLNVLELAPVGRLNLFRTPISLYLVAGPKLDFVIPGKSEAVTFFNNAITQINTQGNGGVSAAYNKMVLGATLGGGLTTGNLLPFELLIEARFNFDITPRFEINYDVPAYTEYYHSHNVYIHSALIRDPVIVPGKYGNNGFQLNIGAAIF